MLDVTIDATVSEKWIGEAILAIVCLEGIEDTGSAGPQLKAEIKSTLADLRATGNAILEDAVVQRMRTTFKAMPDMDPSRYRPASEALIRRCLEKDFVRINPIVDVNNFLSIRLRLPLGVYDLDKIAHSCVYRIGGASETYSTISQMVKNAEGKLVLADDGGVVGSPVSDSGRAVIRNDTSRVAVVTYLPFEMTTTEADSINTEIASAFTRILGAKLAQALVLKRP